MHTGKTFDYVSYPDRNCNIMIPQKPAENISTIPTKNSRLLTIVLPSLFLAGFIAYSWWNNYGKNTLSFEPRAFGFQAQKEKAKAEDKESPKVPELDGGIAWLNTAKPIQMKDLRGKIVVLDFWTLCCINCIHTLPDLAKLEKKYSNELVVIGVHSAKFDNEKDTESIRKAISRYEIKHPVVNDANMKIWRTYGVNSWPSLYLIDPEGNFVARGSGEGLHDALDAEIAKLVKIHREKKTLNEKPIDFGQSFEKPVSPLYFPGKVISDAKSKRIFISDSTNHRVVVTDLDGQTIASMGQGGKPGFKDGSFEEVQFDDPQGLALDGDNLLIADRKNHSIRSADLKKKTVTTVAGTGKQGHDRGQGGDPLKVSLNSPWDIYLQGDQLFIAMAGHHQIWVMDIKKKNIAPFAGNGRETLRDGPPANSCFAQPSGLTTDGKMLYVADSEVSAVRAVPLDGKSDVKTVVGLALFDFGDIDGTGDQVRIQHALGVAYHDGIIYVADTYNSKIKTLNPITRECKTWLGGSKTAFQGGPMFQEPAGLNISDGKIYVADTNAHRIQVIDIKSKEVKTLDIKGLKPIPR